MNNNKEGRKPIYENSLKVAVAREYLTTNLSSRDLALKYNLVRADTVRHFVKWYRSHYPESLDSNPQPLNNSSGDQNLSEQLKEANLKIAGLEMMIEIAQKELGIDIVKKSGTKQSLK
jgi:transposase-like protein